MGTSEMEPQLSLQKGEMRERKTNWALSRSLIGNSSARERIELGEGKPE